MPFLDSIWCQTEVPGEEWTTYGKLITYMDYGLMKETKGQLSLQEDIFKLWLQSRTRILPMGLIPRQESIPGLSASGFPSAAAKKLH